MGTAVRCSMALVLWFHAGMHHHVPHHLDDMVLLVGESDADEAGYMRCAHHVYPTSQHHSRHQDTMSSSSGVGVGRVSAQLSHDGGWS